MLNYLWAGMMAAGIFWAAFHGNMEAVTGGILEAAREAVTLCVTMLGIMSFWCGILKIGEESGLTGLLTEKMKPVIRFLFPNLPADHPAAAHISANMIANMLGLGWAATPAGLRAMEELEKLEEERRRTTRRQKHGDAGDAGDLFGQPDLSGLSGQSGRKAAGLSRPKGTASNEMCTFLIVNISSLQLIPINMIVYRSQYGSINPAAVVGPSLAATTVSTLTAIVYCRLKDRKWRS